MPIIWKRADGSIAVTQLTDEFLGRERREGELTSDAVLRLARDHVQAKVPDLAGLTPVLVKTADMPTDRTRRHAWRLDGDKVIADSKIPDPGRVPTKMEVDAAISKITDAATRDALALLKVI